MNKNYTVNPAVVATNNDRQFKTLQFCDHWTDFNTNADFVLPSIVKYLLSVRKLGFSFIQYHLLENIAHTK